MSRYRLSSLAESDLDGIWLHVATEASAQTADRLIDAITDLFPLLAAHPQMGRQRDEIEPGVRSFPARTHIRCTTWRRNGCGQMHGRERIPFNTIGRVAHLAAALIAMVLTASCGSVECESIVLQSGASADRAFVATVYAVDCGAADGLNLRVRMEQAARPGPHDILVVSGPFNAAVEWLAPRVVKITVMCRENGSCGAADWKRATAAVEAAEHEWRGVRVDYQVDTRTIPPRR